MLSGSGTSAAASASTAAFHELEAVFDLVEHLRADQEQRIQHVAAELLHVQGSLESDMRGAVEAVREDVAALIKVVTSEHTRDMH